MEPKQPRGCFCSVDTSDFSAHVHRCAKTLQYWTAATSTQSQEHNVLLMLRSGHGGWQGKPQGLARSAALLVYFDNWILVSTMPVVTWHPDSGI
jgi:hypothetical protein